MSKTVLGESAVKEHIDKFIGTVMGIDTERKFFSPTRYASDLDLVMLWMMNNDVAYTVSFQPKHGGFMVLVGWEDCEDLVKVVHPDRTVAFVTAFCLLHGDPGYSDLYPMEVFVKESSMKGMVIA